jgi:hypothetical protein
MPSTSLRFLLATALAAWACVAAAAGRPPLVTMQDGDATLLRDGARFALAEGVRLQAGDLIATGAQSRLVRVEYPGGPGFALGPDTRVMLLPNLGDDGMRAGIYLLSGWVKLAAPSAVPGAIRSAVADADTTGGTLILDVQGGTAQAFAESGPSHLQPRATELPDQPMKSGDMLVLAPGAKPALAKGASQAFVQAMPRSFMDTLPPRAAAFTADVPPHRLGEMTYADAQPWIDAEAPLRQVFATRWRKLAADPQFRTALAAGLKSHPEWTPVLYPSGRAPQPAH